MVSEGRKRRTNSVRVVLADDNPAMLETLAGMLGPRYVIAASASCGASAFTQAVDADPDILVLDVSLGDMTGFDVARRLKKAGSTAKILFLSVHENREFVRAAFDAGASGYVFKSQISLDLLKALKAVSKGERFVPVGSMILND